MATYDPTVKTPNPFSDPSNPHTSNIVDPETIQDAINQLQNSYSLLAKAGAPKQHLNSLHSNIVGMRTEMERLIAERRRRDQLDAGETIGPAVEIDDDFDPDNAPNCCGRKLYSGVLEKLQRGDGGFSALWKRRWVRVERGWLKCYSTHCRPEPGEEERSYELRAKRQHSVALCRRHL